MQWTSAKIFFDLDKKQFFMNFKTPENPIFLRSTRAADHNIDMLRVVT